MTAEMAKRENVKLNQLIKELSEDVNQYVSDTLLLRQVETEYEEPAPFPISKISNNWGDVESVLEYARHLAEQGLDFEYTPEGPDYDKALTLKILDESIAIFKRDFRFQMYCMTGGNRDTPLTYLPGIGNVIKQCLRIVGYIRDSIYDTNLLKDFP